MKMAPPAEEIERYDDRRWINERWLSSYPIMAKKVKPRDMNPYRYMPTKKQPKVQAERAENGTYPADAVGVYIVWDVHGQTIS